MYSGSSLDKSQQMPTQLAESVQINGINRKNTPRKYLVDVNYEILGDLAQQHKNVMPTMPTHGI